MEELCRGDAGQILQRPRLLDPNLFPFNITPLLQLLSEQRLCENNMEEKTPEGVPRPLPAWTDPGRHTARRRRFRAGALLLGLLALAGLTHLRVSSRTPAPDQPPRVIRDDDPMNPWESVSLSSPFILSQNISPRHQTTPSDD